MTRRIACLLYPEFVLLDVSGPLEVFAAANAELRRQGRPAAYEILLLGEKQEPQASSGGPRLLADAAWSDIDPADLDTLLVPGGMAIDRQSTDEALLAWLRAAEPRLRRLGSVCSGALVLAAAGLLDGQPATTHWADVAQLREDHPRVQVQGERLHTYVPGGHLFTSAGVSAGIDLALALVEDDLGHGLALAVAQRLVLFLRRPGDQAQFSPLLGSRPASRLGELLRWLPHHLEEELGVERLAERLHLSPRSLARLFVEELGLPPAQYVERLRLEAARGLLQSGVGVAETARRCGMGHPETLRRAFQRQLGCSPRDYAERFA